jgi:lipoprotein-anchoring transpeptidase ErfK/SrfK
MRKALALTVGAMLSMVAFSAPVSAEYSPAPDTVRYYDPATGGFQTIKRTPKVMRESPVKREVVEFDGKYRPGTIVVNTAERRLYYVMTDGKALKYGIGVGRPGFTWQGAHAITRKAEWPGWTPPPAMRKRQPDLPHHMPGGPDNPLGARALYIGSTIYRIHGTAEPWTIGQAVSSGCIRMTNEDVTHLYEQVGVGTRVVVVH